MENQTLVTEICPTTTQSWVKNGALILDVREKDEVERLRVDVPNYHHIPLTEFEDRFQEVDPNQEIVVVCKSGGRSLRAAGFLVNHGYPKVVNMKHGLIRWVEKGFPTKGDVNEVLPASSSSCCSTDSKTGCC